MDELIKAHREAQQEEAQAKIYLADLRAREKEVKEKLSEIADAIQAAEQRAGKALTNGDLEQAIARVEEAQQQECVTNWLLKNLRKSIDEVTSKLPGLRNDIHLAETNIWAAQRDKLIEEVKTHKDVLRLILKAYAADWKSGYGWELDTFIRQKIMGGSFSIDPESMEPLWDEMSREIWPNAPTPEPA